MVGTFQPERLEPMTGLIGKNDAEYPEGTENTEFFF
jgi:hypothetical protein